MTKLLTTTTTPEEAYLVPTILGRDMSTPVLPERRQNFR